jgi:hypothetical protein
LAEVGIVALVDEATGYQSVRDRHELQRILEAYVAQQYLPWTLRFPQEFYQELFRLRKWDWNPDSNKRPKRVGKDTEEIIYDRLPIGVKEKLRENNPEIRPGYRRYAHHQFLSGDIGNPHLERLVAVVTALMKISPSWQSFKKKLNKAVPLPEYPDCTGQIDMAEIEPSFARPLAVFEYDDDEFENE